MSIRATKHLIEELRAVLNRHAMEYRLSYVEVVGTLDMLKEAVIADFRAELKREDDK